MPNLKVEIHFPSEEQKEEFVEMLAWMSTCGITQESQITVYFQTEHEQKKFKKLCNVMKGES